MSTIGTGVLAAFLAGILVDFCLNIRYVMLIELKARQISKIISLVSEKEIKEIMTELQSIIDAFQRQSSVEDQEERQEGS